MGHIKEPKGVDFTVVPQTKPDEETDRLISEFLRKQKLENPKERAKIEAKAKDIIRRYEASRGMVEVAIVSGYIKEPKGVDFTVIPRTKPDEETDRMVSEAIQSYKTKNRNAN
ncbi:MAG: hypothetical protein Q8R96_03545 [Bacteroidota bacterium]|nr:hypothetical protein [Bacteroidota bacterium]